MNTLSATFINFPAIRAWMQPLEWLYGLERLGTVLGLGKTLELLDRLGNPHKGLRCIHIAGTNGKGSVCAILSSILAKAGYKTGMYTSPHMKRFNERIQVNGREITDKKIEGLIKKVKPHYNGQTFFEVTTAMAFLYFREQKVDFLALEVGLGGRLDATNVINPLLSIITNVSLEHTQLLGETVEQIAYEKACIIKKNRAVITLAEKNALRIIKKVAEENNSTVKIPKYKKTNSCFNVNSYMRLKLGLKGDFQVMNAALALKAIDVLKKQGHRIPNKAIKEGLLEAEWPGRFEFLSKNVLADCAHNPAGAEALGKEIARIRKSYEKIISVVGIMKDKDRKSMINEISSFSDYIIFTKPKIKRASQPGELARLTTIKHEIVNDVKNALKKAKKLANPEDLIVICGSIYVVGEAK
jgi:dihydrofolate synthase/folylpolyglutamate synthase